MQATILSRALGLGLILPAPRALVLHMPPHERPSILVDIFTSRAGGYSILGKGTTLVLSLCRVSGLGFADMGFKDLGVEGLGVKAKG